MSTEDRDLPSAYDSPDKDEESEDESKTDTKISHGVIPGVTAGAASAATAAEAAGGTGGAGAGAAAGAGAGPAAPAPGGAAGPAAPAPGGAAGPAAPTPGGASGPSAPTPGGAAGPAAPTPGGASGPSAPSGTAGRLTRGRGFVRRTAGWASRSTLHSVLVATTAVAVVGGTIAGVALTRHHGAPPNGGARNTGGANQGGGRGNAANPGRNLHGARLEGTWKIKAGTMTGTWTFTPACARGPCGGSSVRTADDFGPQGQPVDVTASFRFSGGTFRGTERYTATCGNEVSAPFSVPVADVFQFAVSKAALVDGQLQATKIEGFTNHSAQIVQAGSSACGYNVGTVPLTGRLAG